MNGDNLCPNCKAQHPPVKTGTFKIAPHVLIALTCLRCARIWQVPFGALDRLGLLDEEETIGEHLDD